MKKLVRKNGKKGSVFILSLIFATTVAIGVASVVALQSNFHKSAVKSLDRVSALYNAESAIQLAIHEMRHRDSATTMWVGGGWQYLRAPSTIYVNCPSSYSPETDDMLRVTRDGILFVIKINAVFDYSIM